MVRSEGNMLLKNPVTPPGIDPGTVRLVAQRLNHYATLGPIYIYKCKVHLVAGHKGPEGEQKYSSTLPSTSALDGGGWSTSRPGRFIPRKDPVPSVQEVGSAPGPVCTGAEILAPHRDSIPGPSSP